MKINFTRDSLYNFYKVNKQSIIKFTFALVIFSVAFFVFAVKSYEYKNMEDLEVIHEGEKKEIDIVENKKKCCKKQITVYIVGEIKKPDVYEIDTDKRMKDIIAKAGGFTEYAYIENLNLARKLNDGEKIVVYNYNEVEKLKKSGKLLDADSINQEQDMGNNVQKNNLININTATLEELQSLKGIGPSTANKIIIYRKNKCFAKKEDILNVKGIGNKTFEKFKDQIIVN